MMATMMLASRAENEKRRIYARGLRISRLELRRFTGTIPLLPLDLHWAFVKTRSPNNSPHVL
jgi:hypothetical protein